MADLTVVKRVANDVDVSAGGGVLAAVTDLNLDVLTGQEVFFEYTLHYSTGNNIGARFGVNTTGTGTIRVGTIQPIDNTTVNFASSPQLNTEIFVATAGGNAVQRMAIVAGVFLATAPGTFSIQAASESGGAMTLYAGSSALFQYVGADAKTGAEAVPVGLTDVAVAVITSQALAATEMLPTPVAEAQPLAVTVASVDTVPLDVVAAHRGLDVAGAEGLAVGLTEADAAVDKQTAGTPVVGADTVSLALTEDLQDDRDLASPLAVGLAEALAGQGTAAQTEALPFPLAGEVAVAADVSPVTEKAGTETLPTPLQEAVAGTGSADRPDTLATPLVEALSSLLGALVRPDSLPAGLLEAIAGLGTAAQAEALAAHLTELVALAATLPGTETLPVGLGELGATTGVAAVTGTDMLAAPVTEATAGLRGQIAQPDSVPLRLAGEVTPVAVTLPTPDSPALILLEALAAAVTLPATETLPVRLTDAQVLGQLSFLTGADTVPMPLVEGTASVEAGGQINQASAETLAVALQELQAAFGLLQRLDSLAVGLSEARALAAFLAQSETTALGLSERLTGAGAATLADDLGVTLEALEQVAAFLATAEPTGVELVDFAVALQALGPADAVALLLEDATMALTTITVATDRDEASISLTEASAILAAITVIRRLRAMTLERVTPTYTVDAVIRVWEVESLMPPYTLELA